MGRKGVLTALKPGRLVYLVYMVNGRVYTTSRCYRIIEISEHRGAQYATLGPAAGLHPFGAKRGVELRQHCDDLILVQPDIERVIE